MNITRYRAHILQENVYLIGSQQREGQIISWQMLESYLSLCTILCNAKRSNLSSATDLYSSFVRRICPCIRATPWRYLRRLRYICKNSFPHGRGDSSFSRNGLITRREITSFFHRIRGSVVRTRDKDCYFTLISVFVISLGDLKELSLFPTYVRNILSILGFFTSQVLLIPNLQIIFILNEFTLLSLLRGHYLLEAVTQSLNLHFHWNN
jgi:hypothetical protein